MITFLAAFALLLLGYFVYGAIVEKIFGSDECRKTPCYTMRDGVDYEPMLTWKVFQIQFLDISIRNLYLVRHSCPICPLEGVYEMKKV